MVRTKTRARSPLPGATSVHRDGGKIIHHNRIFNDHTGKPALMSWKNSPSRGMLPPLASWVYYMVHPDVSHDFEGENFASGLTSPSSWGGRGGICRHEFFFLPGATAEECHAHYLGEIKARGTIWRQIRKVSKALELKNQGVVIQKEEKPWWNDDSDDEDEDSECQVNAFVGQKEYDWVHDPSFDEEYADCQLPGLVWPMNDRAVQDIDYRGWFFIYHDEDTDGIRGKEGSTVSLVRFDPIPYEWDEENDGVRTWDPMDHPIWSVPIPVVNESNNEYTVGMWQDARKESSWEARANEATSDAWDMGWETW
ncbi:hypothetical protein FPOA_06773 [Fusarium poae]|uniref:Uncharacterized protein n=1 Tax=Fusarium poae TaxID=36050 RepID=A0A1B8AIN5_FUSPO|nr:hypothetical protein FPOA_06773 [Fusarium poae]